MCGYCNDFGKWKRKNNLMRKKTLLIILIIVVWGLALAGAIFLFTKKPTEKICTIKYIERSDASYLFIPATINDSVYHPVLFHTGASINYIDSVLAQKVGFNTLAMDLVKKMKSLPQISDSIALDAKMVSIGDFSKRVAFQLNGYKGFYHINAEYMRNAGVIMGMDFIKDYNWLFNFADTTVTISKGQIPIPALPDDQILSLNYHTKRGFASVDLLIGDDTIRNVAFNTGLIYPTDIVGKKKYCDIVFSTADCEAIENKPNIINNDTIKSKPRNTTKLVIHNNGIRTIFIDSIQVNQLEIQGLLAYENPDFVQTNMTSTFISRFRMMYFDSTNRQIQLYVSPSDSTRHHRRDLQEFIYAITKHFEEDGSLSFPGTILDLLL